MSEVFKVKEIEDWDQDYSTGYMPSIFVSKKRSAEQIDEENQRFKRNGYVYYVMSGSVDGWIARPF